MVTTLHSGIRLPALIAGSAKSAALRFLEFFTVNICNANTRAAYTRAVAAFLAWCEGRGQTELRQVQPVHVAAYIEQLGRERSAPTVKQHLAGGLGCFFARIAAAETCASLIASGSPVTRAPVASIVPMQDFMTQLRQNAFQACQSLESNPSSRHSSRNEKSAGERSRALAAAKSLRCRAIEFKSLSSSVQLAWSATAMQTRLEARDKAI